jgi:hypothetical protein
MQQLVLIVLRAPKFANYLAEGIVLRRTKSRKIIDDEVVDGENICKLDVQRWLCSSEQIVKLVNLELRLSVANVNYYNVSVVFSISGNHTYDLTKYPANDR